MGCHRLSYLAYRQTSYETKKTRLRVVSDEPEKVVVIAYRIELNDGTCAERSRSKVVQGWLLPDPAMQFPNPYLGIGNNPVNYIDPDGEFIIESMLFSGLMHGIGASSNGGNFFEGFMKGALFGGVTAGFSLGTDMLFQNIEKTGLLQQLSHSSAKGFQEGLIEKLNGGKFINGFASGSINAYASGSYQNNVLAPRQFEESKRKGPASSGDFFYF